jgi:hypothetical protein
MKSLNVDEIVIVEIRAAATVVETQPDEVDVEDLSHIQREETPTEPGYGHGV